LRYLKPTLICGTTAALVALGMLELGAFRGLDARLATFVGLSSPVVERALQYVLVLLFSYGIAWTTVDIAQAPLKIAIAAVAFAECIATVWVEGAFGGFFSPFASVAAIVVAFSSAFIFSRTAEGRRKSEIHELIGGRVSQKTLSALIESKAPLKFDGEVRAATVLVCELFNQQQLLAAMRVPDYVAMTNAFLKNSADFLVERGAYLDECDGESLRVVFGAPLSDTRHAARACETALELVSKLDAVNEECISLWKQRFDFRIGINSGDMVMAAYGSNRLGAFSVSGETVEFARRLCAANTIYGSRILIGNGAFVQAEDAIEVRPMELIQRQPQSASREEVYELLGARNRLSSTDRERRDLFWKGIVFFREKKWDEALASFKRTIEVNGGDGPAEFYIRRIEQMRAGLPSLDWAGSRV
jgi:class 3 adenylate cyclase